MNLSFKKQELPFLSEVPIQDQSDTGRVYISYGSNLNISQMAARAPSAQPLGAGYLVGWSLVFRRVADIRRGNKTDLLPIGFWKLKPSDEVALDKYEGWPRVYRKVLINGLMTYLMNSDELAEPTTQYYQTIEEGYRDFGLDLSFLEAARDKSIA